MAKTNYGRNVSYDYTKFNRAMTQLAKMTGKSFKTVLNHELASILEKSIGWTKAAKSKLIDERYTYKAGEKPSERLVGRLRIHGKMRTVKSIKPNSPLWSPLQKKLQAEKKEAKSRKGLAKATWYKQAQDMKLKLKGGSVPKYVKTAYTKIGRAAAKTSARVWKREPYVILVKNAVRVTMLRHVEGYGAFKRAMSGRTGYFKKNLKKGVFKKSSSIAEKYGFDVEN